MDLSKLKDFLLDSKDAEFNSIIQVINEIHFATQDDNSKFDLHRVLREKYFFLVQLVIDSSKNELLIKFILIPLKEYLIEELKCDLCPLKEKSHFLLNILRFIQHASFHNELTKLEFFKFLINNHETIEPYLTSKILDCLINISVSEFECENKFLQSSSKALIIKYVAVVCNQSKKILKFDENKDEQLKCFDSFVVDSFGILLDIFNQEFRSFELRNLILECIEQLLNNLIVENKNLYDIRKNELFIEFAWQKFCPSILCQFGNCGLPNKSSQNQTLNFKQIYTILIQLTSLIGGNKTMIPVFEAIYQRVLTFSPDQDNYLILKLFKSYMTKDFIISLVSLNGRDYSELSINDLSLINLIVGYYRNCFEQSNKHPSDRVLQFLSFECIHSFINLVYEFYEDNFVKKNEILVDQNLISSPNSNRVFLDDKNEALIDTLSDEFVNKIFDVSTKLSEVKFFNIGQEIKKFSVNLIETADENFLKKNSFKLLIATHLSLYYLVNRPKNTIDRSMLINRVLMYDECDFKEEPDCQEEIFKAWLEKIFFKMSPNSFEISDENLKQVDCLIKQIDCWWNISSEKNSNEPQLKYLILVKKILKCCWIYLVDVLIGFLEYSKFDSIETALFNESTDDILSEDASNDITYLKFAIKSNLDSLHKLIKMLTSIESLDKELDQIFFILIESNFYKNSLVKSAEELSLNKIISLDFVLFATINLLLDTENSSLPRTANSDKILWKYLMESFFFSLSLQANFEFSQNCVPKNSYKDTFTKYLLSKKQKIFSSVYSNLNEANEASCVSRTKSLDLTDKYLLNDQIIQSLFYFLNKSKLTLSIKIDRIDLIDCIANKAYDCLFNKLFAKLIENKEFFFDHVWKLCSNMCLFSKRFLTDEPKLRTQHEYFSFNFLIIDKLEDLLTRLMANSELFIFFIDIWLSVYLTYFDKVFSKCGSMGKFSVKSETVEKKFGKKIKKETSQIQPCFIIDFSIFKKIIHMIQNVFEMYNSTNLTLDYLQYMNKRVSLDKKCISTPSVSPSASPASPLPINHDFTEPNHLIQKLELYKNELNTRTKGELASKIFYTNTISLLIEPYDKISPEIYSIDQIYNLNNILLIPYKRLMLRKSLESNLRDTILASICELVERSSLKIINCWSLIFHCLSRVVLDEKVDKSLPKKLDTNQSDSSVYSSEDETGLTSSGSSSSDSERCFTKSSFILPSVPYRFESYRIRLNSLKEVFKIFLSLAQDSEYIMAFGAFEFLKCVSNYLQYTTSIDFSNKIHVHKVEKSDQDDANLSSDQENEDLFLSANDYSIQERHYHFTSNYEHLCQLSNATNSNTQNEPFINCIRTMFYIILKCKKSSDSSKFSIQIKNFEISTFEKKSNFDLENLKQFCANEETGQLINAEDQDQIDGLNFEFKKFFLNDSNNYSKILIYIFKNLASRILMAHDEINSVQIVQLMFDLASELVQNNELETLGYVILDVLLEEINLQIDLCELKNVRNDFIDTKFNSKLLINSFFISNLVSKMIEKMIILCTGFIKRSQTNHFHKLIIYSISNRIIHLISKCLVKKLTNFDAFPEANYTHQLKDLYMASFNFGDPNLSKICQKSIRLFHALSLSPFENLCISRNKQQNDDKKNFGHLEVLTQKCKTAWELHNVKKAFQYAKLLLNSDNLKSNQSFDEFDNGMENFENEDDSLVSTNDDKNFFRDFSLKFGTNSSMNTKIFGNLDDFKQINLTCFINMFKFHYDFLNLFKYLFFDKDEYFIYEVIKCLTFTYLVSIKLEQNLSLKILLSKIFYLNYENCLATFINLTRKSFNTINFVYFKKDLIKLELNFESKIEKFNYDSLSEFSNLDRLKILVNKDPKKNFFAQYFSTFINQVNSYYQFLFEKSHQIKLVGGVFENFLDKFENKDLSDYSEEMLSKKIDMFMEDFKKKNKIDLESIEMSEDGDGEKIYSDRDNRNLFRIWSQEIVPYLFLNLSKQVSEEVTELNLVNLINFYSSQDNSKKCLIKNFVELILLFNSCSAFCKCSANIENEFSFSKIDFNTFKSITNKLMSILAILVSKK